MRISVQDAARGQIIVEIDFPDYCPICEKMISPHFVTGYVGHFGEVSDLHCAFLCPNPKCSHLFLAIYEKDGQGFYIHQRSFPDRISNIIFEPTIGKVSPDFPKIYNQAITAEINKLDQISGMGLRKALEFLVKDYAMDTKREDIEKIKKMSLRDVIEGYLTDQNLKELAKRASWLGNDETHYLRKWTDKDVRDLKRMIHILVNLIDNEITTRKYLDEMPSGK